MGHVLKRPQHSASSRQSEGFLHWLVQGDQRGIRSGSAHPGSQLSDQHSYVPGVWVAGEEAQPGVASQGRLPGGDHAELSLKE